MCLQMQWISRGFSRVCFSFYQKTTPGVRKTTRKAKKSGDEEDDEDGDSDDDEDDDDVDEMSIMEKCRKAEAASKSKYGNMCRCVDRQCK